MQGSAGSLSKSVAPPVTPSMMAAVSNGLYNWEVGRKEREEDPKITGQMLRVFENMKHAALSDPVHAEVAREMDWRLAVLRDYKTSMADAYPGGGIAIYEGVFEVAENEGALAAILGHEIGHVLARHELKQLSGDAAVALGTAGPAITSGTAPDKLDPKAIGPVAGALGLGYVFGVRQPVQRENELEADCLGLVLTAKAGYDPKKSEGFWRRMDEEPGASDKYDFLNGHPMNEERFTHIRETCLPPALEVYEKLDAPDRKNALTTLPKIAVGG
ncbi:hypothetical protein YTPLAS18_31010 [Nitrospira sp.]|nr:hypothetical protein YTPLAS18_31010 [Nitrospira sp.]